MIKNILVLVDFQDPKALVVERAASLALAFQAKCWLIHVAAPEPDFIGYEPGPQYVRDERARELRAEHVLLQKLKEWLATLGIESEALLIQGRVAETILTEAEKLHADLLVLGRHKHSTLHEWVIGSVGKEVIRRSEVPVVVVPIHKE
jgi:nucleotide-binding universal stress UspA family protein